MSHTVLTVHSFFIWRHIHIQQIILLPIQYDDHLLFFKWKQIIRIFITVSFTMNKKERRRKRGGLSAAEVEEGKGYARDKTTLNVTLWKYIIVCLNFLLFHISKYVFTWHQSFTISFNFSAHITEGSIS